MAALTHTAATGSLAIAIARPGAATVESRNVVVCGGQLGSRRSRRSSRLLASRWSAIPAGDENGPGSSKRRTKQHLCIVAASPPKNDEHGARSREPLTRQDLVAYLASGCKPKEKWRIGTEHEKFGFQLDSLQPMTYDQISRLLNGMSERFEWERVMEGDNIIGLTFVSSRSLSFSSSFPN